jgi:site-specific DNA recombinase
MTPEISRHAPKLVRCAIYTRKSTEEGLKQEFNTLDAQREAGEAYIKSQTHEGWICVPERYDDGGFTGANLERPALKRLLEQVASGRVNAVIVYKVDRLSRSLLDFARLMQVFEQHQVAFVSVTQSFNSATSMGRLVLNVLLSFAQFEREIISERTRDKLAATRKKGKWIGGHPPLGYHLDTSTSKLVVFEEEAQRVREIFLLYLKHESLLPVVRELQRRGWTTKSWITKAGVQRPGRPFDRTSLHRLLTTVLYTGRVHYQGQLYPGEQQAILEMEQFQRVQTLLREKRRTYKTRVRNQFGALLMGILRCGPCGCAMTPTYACKVPHKRYRYYNCIRAQKSGRENCPSRTVPAAQIEGLVVQQIRQLGCNPNLLEQVLAEPWRESEARLASLEAERRSLDVERARFRKRGRGKTLSNGHTARSITQSPDRIAYLEQRIACLNEQITDIQRQRIDQPQAAAALTEFASSWEALGPAEQRRSVLMLLERVEYDGRQGKVKIAYSPIGIRTLIQELLPTPEETGSCR